MNAYELNKNWKKDYQTIITHSRLQYQWRTQKFRMGGVEVPQAPRVWGVGCGEEYLLPTGGRVWGGGCSPSSPPQKIFRIFC